MDIKNSISLILILTTAVFTDSCKQTTEVTAGHGVIIPLKVGNTWVEKYTFYDTLGNSTNNYIDSLKVTSDTVIENERWYSYTNFTYNGLFTNRPGGYYMRYRNAYDTSYTTILFWKYPVNQNEIYYVQNAGTFVKSINDNVTTAAGSFNCIQYRFQYTKQPGRPNSGHEQAWLCPGIGPVLTMGYDVTLSGNEYLYFSVELISYKLN